MQSSATRLPTSAMTALVLVALAHVFVDASISVLAALLPTFQVRFDLSPVDLALLVATLSVTTSLAQPVLGSVADRFGHRLLIAVGAVTATTLLTLAAWAPSMAVLLALLTVGGLGSAAFHPAVATAVRNIGGDPDVAVGVLGAGGMLGLSIGPLAVLALVHVAGPVAAGVVAVPGAVLGLLLWRSLPEIPLPPRNRIFDGGLLRGTTGRLTLAAALMHLASVTFMSATPMMLVAAGYDPGAVTVGLVLATFTGGAAFGSIGGAALVKRLGRRTVTVGAMLGAAGPLIGTLLLPPDHWAFWIAVAAAGALVHAALPTVVVAGQDAAPGAETAAAGLLVGGAVATAGLAYVGVGFLQTAVGLELASAAAFLAVVPAAAVAAGALQRRPQGVDAPVRRPAACLCLTPA